MDSDLMEMLEQIMRFGKNSPLQPINTSGLPGKVDAGSTIAKTINKNNNSFWSNFDGDKNGGDNSFWSNFAGDKNGGGWGMPAIAAGKGLLDGYLGMKQFGLAKDQFKFQKNAFNKNFEAQQKTTNSQLEDRQNARNAVNPGAHQSTAEYMSRFGI